MVAKHLVGRGTCPKHKLRPILVVPHHEAETPVTVAVISAHVDSVRQAAHVCQRECERKRIGNPWPAWVIRAISTQRFLCNVIELRLIEQRRYALGRRAIQVSYWEQMARINAPHPDTIKAVLLDVGLIGLLAMVHHVRFQAYAKNCTVDRAAGCSGHNFQLHIIRRHLLRCIGLEAMPLVERLNEKVEYTCRVSSGRNGLTKDEPNREFLLRHGPLRNFRLYLQREYRQKLQNFHRFWSRIHPLSRHVAQAK